MFKLITSLVLVLTLQPIANGQEHYQLDSRISEHVTVSDITGKSLSLQKIIADSGAELSDPGSTMVWRQHGFINSTIYLSSDVKDTDITIKLIDVYPDGTAYNIDETIQRVRYREGYEKEVFMESGKVYKVDLSQMSTSNYFKKNHRIRIEISSSNFPRFARNLNTGGDNFNESKGLIARNTIHHSKKYPSSVTR